ncbi:MAG: hypothetical protein JSR15_07395 [Proteobacteria bacterium]|nr:hypothetical protein [Pseudomonadota bacterium]
MRSTKPAVWSLILAAVLVQGCVSTKTVPLDSEKSTAIQSKSIVLAVRPMPSFAFMTPGKAALGGMFGAIGGAAAGASMASEGENIIRSDKIEDPALVVGKAVLDMFAARDHLTVEDAHGVLTQGQKPEEIIKPYPGVNMVLDIETVNWTAMYFPMNWSHYGVMYSIKATLIDAATAKPVAEAFCAARPKKTDQSPTKAELLADGGARLKAMSAEAADHCREELETKLFGSAH